MTPMLTSAALIATSALLLVPTWGYSGGAPPDVCEDMTPKHPAPPQKTKMPYTVTTEKNEIQPGQKLRITITAGRGAKPFKGFLLQVRSGKNPVGSFEVADDDRYVKTINCGTGIKNAATHKNSADKKALSINWVAPKDKKGQYQVYVTVAENGAVYWVKQPTALFKVV